MSARTSIALGIDVGTSGVRIAAIDHDGSCAEAQAALPAGTRSANTHEQDPGDWWHAVTTCLDDILARLDRDRVEAVAVAGTSGSLLFVDSLGRPLTAALMYDDARAGAEASEISRLVPEGMPGHTAVSPLAKALWLARHRTLGGAFHLCHQADWIAGRLAGRFAVSDENNALKTGYDPVARSWPVWMKQLELPADFLPEVRPAGSRFAKLDPTVAHRFGLRESCQVVLGTTDSIAGFLATGATEIGDAATAIGTTLAVKMLVDRPAFNDRQGIYSHRLGHRWLIGGASNVGGAILVQYFTSTEIEELSGRIDPEHPTGLAYYPLARPGERFPIMDPTLAPRLEPRPAEQHVFLQAIFEGIAEVERLGYEKLAALSQTAPRAIYSTGRVARNAVLARIRSRAMRTPIRPYAPVAAAHGVAKLAFGGLAA